MATPVLTWKAPGVASYVSQAAVEDGGDDDGPSS